VHAPEEVDGVAAVEEFEAAEEEDGFETKEVEAWHVEAGVGGRDIAT
jgi:hypothetical protein